MANDLASFSASVGGRTLTTNSLTHARSSVPVAVSSAGLATESSAMLAAESTDAVQSSVPSYNKKSCNTMMGEFGYEEGVLVSFSRKELPNKSVSCWSIAEASCTYAGFVPEETAH